MNESKIFPNKDCKRRLLDELKRQNIASFTVEFSGYGDSGSISGISIRKQGESEDDAWNRRYGGGDSDVDLSIRILWRTSKSVWNQAGERWDKISSDVELTVEQAIEGVVYEALEQAGLDWYNNDGGQGSMRIDIEGDAMNMNLQVGINYTSTQDYEFPVINDWRVDRLPLP